MYYIDSSIMSPDHDNLRQTILQSMKEGVQLQNLETLRPLCDASMQMAARQLQDAWGITKPNSPDAIVRFLQSCDIPEVHEACCENGKWSSKADGLRLLAQQGFNFAVDILTYRKASSYAKAIKSLQENARGNGRIYPVVGVQKTNRINYSSPALMNIPKALLWSVVAPRTPGYSLVTVDIHQQEPLIVINMLGIEGLKLIAEENEDIYRAMYQDIFGCDCTEVERAEFKTCWNATTYGASKKTLVDRCRFIDGGAVYTAMHRYKELSQYIGSSYAKANRNIQKVQTYFGTELWANEAGSRLRRSLLDLPIQGTGADLLAFLVKHLQEVLEDNGLDEDIKLYYSRHDECVLEVRDDLISSNGVEAITDTLKDIFEHQVDDWVPFRVHVEFPEPDYELLNSAEAMLERGKAEGVSEDED